MTYVSTVNRLIHQRRANAKRTVRRKSVQDSAFSGPFWCASDRCSGFGSKPFWTDDHKTCVLPVQLKPGWEYRLGLNSPSHKNMPSAGGVPL